MELVENKKVFFDKVSHSYTNEDGVLLMGVTELLSKHGISPDYSGIPAKKLKEAAAKGTAIHEYLQAYENGEMVPTSDLLDEYKQLGLKFLASEFLISDNEMVASSIDMLYQSGEDSVIICDIKTTEKAHIRSVQWQTSIYKYLFERQCPGIKVSALYLLWADKKAEKLREFRPLEPIPDEEVEKLLECEKNGLIYIDENDIPDASLVLKEDGLATYISKANEIAALKAKIKEIEAGLKFYDERLMAYMMENGIEKLSANGGTFSLKKPYTQIRVDAAALKNKFPAIFSKVSKEIECRGSITFKGNEK